jgi:hypothetical protein
MMSRCKNNNEILVIRQEFGEILFSLDERRIRLWCAARSRAYNRKNGRGGVTVVHKATGVSRRRICEGLKEIENPEKLDKSRIRGPGGGRKKISESQPLILEALEALVDPDSRGDPESPLRWTSKSTYRLSEELNRQGYEVSHAQVGKLLNDPGCSLQSNKKTKEGSRHTDRNAQFGYINDKVKWFHAANQPAISVDTKKKENIGEYKNPGREYCPQKHPLEVNGHDFPDKKLGKVIPYGIYDLRLNKGWVSIGINNDTAEFAVNAIRTWCHEVGKVVCPKMKSLLITADCGGSNGYRVRLWKRELQKLADESKTEITVCHYPPGTSKRNKTEHRMFSFISKNWRGKPLIDRQTVIELIGHTKTKNGLKIKVVIDENVYKKGIRITDEEMKKINLEKDRFHGEWNYKIKPRI